MDKTGPLQPLLEPVVRSLLGVVVDMKVDFEVEMFWNRVNGARVIQAHAPPQPPVIMCVPAALPPPPRTKWTRRVPHPVLIGHAASLAPY